MLLLAGHSQYLNNWLTVLLPRCWLQNLSDSPTSSAWKRNSHERSGCASREAFKCDALFPHPWSFRAYACVFTPGQGSDDSGLAHKMSVLMAAPCLRELTNASVSVCMCAVHFLGEKWTVECKNGKFCIENISPKQTKQLQKRKKKTGTIGNLNLRIAKHNHLAISRRCRIMEI